MKYLILGLLLCTSAFADNRTKVVVIDSGVSFKQSIEDYMCKNESKSFVNDSIYDQHGHGTNIISIISKQINPKTHCIISYKVWYPNISGISAVNGSIKALKLTSQDLNVRFVNISMEGPQPNNMERFYIKRLLLRGVELTVAAGNGDDNNKAIDLDKNCSAFPACYKKDLKYSNFHVVTASLSSSNYGSIVTDKFFGYRVGTPAMSGTSQASAQKMEEILKSVVLSNRRTNGTQTNDRGSRNYR